MYFLTAVDPNPIMTFGGAAPGAAWVSRGLVWSFSTYYNSMCAVVRSTLLLLFVFLPIDCSFFVQVEEEEYARACIDAFSSGLLSQVAEGTTLRAFLSERLQCQPMRGADRAMLLTAVDETKIRAAHNQSCFRG